MAPIERTVLAPTIGAFLYRSKSEVIGMAKCFTQQEKEILKANPNVKAVRENRLTLTYEFRLKLWEHYQKGDSLKTVFIQHEFDLQVIDAKYIKSIKLKKHIIEV